MNIVDTSSKQDGWLIGGGEMAALIKAKDWSATPLGPIDAWPQSLRTVVSLVQASNSPISLSWGPGHVQIYNDGYWPICGAKHPHAMGQDFRECWASAFPVIGAGYASAWAGKTAYLENMRMFLDRYGFLEETWFTFSFSPITDESGEIAGVFHPVTELTGQSLSERRTETLRNLAACTAKCKTVQAAFDAAAQMFEQANLDLPFVLFYLADESGRSASLVAQAGLPAGTPISPAQVDLHEPAPLMRTVAEVLSLGSTEQWVGVADCLQGLSVGPYPELPPTAFALPITLPGHERPAGVMVAGVSARLRVDGPYRDFLGLVALSVSAALANARAHEDERRKSEALAEIDRAKTAFFSNVSHEFRTPLTLMLGPLEDELNEREPLPAARRERIELAHRNCMRLLKLVNGLLDFSRIEAGRVQALYEPTDLATLTADLASGFRSAFERVGLTLTTDCPPLPEPLYVDREMWEKVVLNLLSNAFKHTFEGGICVRLAWLGNAAQLTVQDTGVGIAAAEMPKLFERFYRVKGAGSRTHEGTGIGLSLAREFVQLHGGEIRAESELGQGSRFIVTLKAGSAHLPADKIGRTGNTARPGAHAAAYVQEALHWLPSPSDAPALDALDDPHSATPAQPIPSGPRQRVLLADDNADMRSYVARLLAAHYEVQAVPDGQAALEAACAAPPDLVLSDVMMPRLDGFGLLKALRANEGTRELPVILLSARAGEESAVEGLEAGADDYLVKPFSAKELLARVRSNLSLASLRKEWAAKLKQTLRELADAADSKSRFMTAISHEIRTPLNAVIGMAGLLAGTPLSREQAEFADTIRTSADHLLTVINNILDYSKLESGKLQIEQVAFNVADVVEGALEMVSAMTAGKDLALAYELGPEVGSTVIGDPGRVRQVLLNFLSNAVKFTACGEVVVSVGARNMAGGMRQIEFAVRDTGMGLTPQQCDQIFKPFTQVDGSISRKYGGTGLGLVISRQLAKAMGGDAGVASTYGQGSTFRFSITTAAVSAGTAASAGDAAPPLAGSTAWIADHHEGRRRIHRRLLESWGMAVHDAGDAAQVLGWANRGLNCDVAVIDAHLPKTDGVDLAAQLHKQRGPAIRLLMLGSMGAGKDAAAAARIGSHARLTQPLRHAALLQTVARLLDRDAGPYAPTGQAQSIPADLGLRMPLRILVAEDNPINVTLITLLLERMGYRCDVAGNGLEALAALRRQPYDLVLMDVQMPEMDGIEATRQIHRDWQHEDRPRIVALTAGVMPEERQSCLDAGMAEVLNKPVVTAELTQALERCWQHLHHAERPAPN